MNEFVRYVQFICFLLRHQLGYLGRRAAKCHVVSVRLKPNRLRSAPPAVALLLSPARFSPTWPPVTKPAAFYRRASAPSRHLTGAMRMKKIVTTGKQANLHRLARQAHGLARRQLGRSRGELVFVIGPSGSGMSTMRCCNRLRQQPSEGRSSSTALTYDRDDRRSQQDAVEGRHGVSAGLTSIRT